MGETCSICGQQVKFIGNYGSHVALKHTTEFLEFMESIRPANRPEERAEPVGKETSLMDRVLKR